MGDPFDSIAAACNLPSSQQRLLDQSLYAREDEEDEPSPIHNPPLFTAADGNSIATSSPSPAEEFLTPPEDPRRQIETDPDPIPVGEKRFPESRSPIEEAPSPAKKARVSESSSILQTEVIHDDYDNCDTEEIDDDYNNYDTEEIECDTEVIEDYDEDDGEANTERTGGGVDMLMEVLALLAREELQHRCHDSGGVDIFETAKRLGIKFPGDELH